MKLIDELNERREAVANRLEDAFSATETLRAELDDLDRAIEALEPVSASAQWSTDILYGYKYVRPYEWPLEINKLAPVITDK